MANEERLNYELDTSTLAHVRKISSGSYEEKLNKVLIPKMGKDAALAYRNLYHEAYKNNPKPSSEISTITVNISELCNFKCIMCDVPGNNRKSIGSSVLSILEFLEQAASTNTKCCMLGSGSEITLHPEWRDIVRKAIKLFPDTILFTNGSTLSDPDLEFLVKEGLTRLFISLDAANKNTFKQIRGFDMLEEIENKIHKAISIKNSLKSTSPLIRVSFVVQEENKNEINTFSNKWINVVDSVEFQTYSDIASFRDRNFVNALPKIKPKDSLTQPKCHYPFSYLSLWADGKLSPCCTSYGRDSEELHLANIQDNNALEKAIAKRKDLQEAFNSNDWSRIPNACIHCLDNN